MIPIKIEISNFLSYREREDLDFHGIHLACISGANGAGKSSILDAITWSLFGKCRVKSDDAIVNRVAVGKSEAAEVRFTFELEGVIYRVIRRKRMAKPQRLEFQVASHEGKWKTLSESKIRETQTAIETLLKLNYDTFTNASFLLQGKADEFTTKTPNHRKEILADLLGVNEWDLLKDKVTEKRKREESQLFLIDSRVADIDAELDQRPEREIALAAAVERLNQVNTQLQLLEERLIDARGTAAAIEQQQQAVKSLEESVERIRLSLVDLDKTHEKRQHQRQAFQEILAQAESIQLQYQALQQMEYELQELQRKAQAANAIQLKKKPFELKIEGIRSSLVQRRKELEDQRRRIEHTKIEKDQLLAELKNDRQEESKLSSRLAENGLKEDKVRETNEVVQRLRSEIAVLDREADQLRGRLRVIEGLNDEETIVIKNLNSATSSLEVLAGDLKLIAAQNDRLMTAMADKGNLASRQDELMKRMRERRGQVDQLQTDSTGFCPLCSQPLSSEHHQAVLGRFEAEGQLMADEYRNNRQQLESLAAEIPVLQAKVKSRSKVEGEIQSQQQRQASASARLQEIDRLREEWERESSDRLAEIQTILTEKNGEIKLVGEVVKLQDIVDERKALEQKMQKQRDTVTTKKARLDEIERRHLEWYGIDKDGGLQAQLSTITHQLENEEYGLDSRAQMAILNNELAAIGFDEEAYQKVQSKRDQFLDTKESYEQLQKAEAALKPLDESLIDLKKQIRTQRSNLDDVTAQSESATRQLDLLRTTAYDVSELESEVYAAREAQISVNRQVATSQQSILVLDDLENQKREIRIEKDRVQQLIRRLRLLEKACGRNGVQALLIEQALPEIEDDANEILRRLSGGKMQILFETQRKLKSRDSLAETLDIRIGDDVGERPYENYSGGEKFRVNFAIRLALSKILSRRAGARLQTLVIDEGFGSQDPEGRQRLTEAINTIKNDFERILIITHIDSMRDKFPTTIEVVKELGGSKISVVGD